MNKAASRLALATISPLLIGIGLTLTPCLAHADLLVSNFGGFVMRYPDGSVNQAYNFTTFPNTVVFPSSFTGDSANFDSAAGVTQGPDGNIYVSSYDQGQVLQYSPTGAFLNDFVTLPQDYVQNGDGSYSPINAAPAHLQFYNGSLYVSDNNGISVWQYTVNKNPTTGALSIDPNVAPTAAVSGLEGAGAFTFAPNGDLYASNFGGPIYGDPPVAVVKVSNGVQTNFAYPAFNEGVPSPEAPNGLLFVNNMLLVVDLEGNKILKYNSSGTYEGVFATIPSPGGVTPPPDNNFPSDMVLSRDGKSIYLAVLGYTRTPGVPPDGGVLQYDLNGNLIATVATCLPIASSIALGVQKGDFNLDGQIDVGDISAMEAALSNLPTYESNNNLSDDELKIIGDVNGDGQINNADLQALLNLVRSEGTASTAPVPEPDAFALAAAALFAFGFQCYRRQWSK
jgi:hypothetical protein